MTISTNMISLNQSINKGPHEKVEEAKDPQKKDLPYAYHL